MPRACWLYTDETFPAWVDEEAKPCQVVLVAGLSLDRPVGPQAGQNPQWLIEALRTPHATDLARQIGQSNQKFPALLGDGILRGLWQQHPAAHLSVLGTTMYDGQLDAAIDALNLALVVHVILREGLGSGDTLHIFPERRAEDSGLVTMGRFASLTGALRWLPALPRGVPRVKVEVFPSEAHILIGQTVVDFGLWNLQSALKHSRETDWLAVLQTRLAELRLQDRIHVDRVPALEQSDAAVAWQRMILGHFQGLSWRSLAAVPLQDVVPGLQRELAALPEAERSSVLHDAAIQLQPLVQNEDLRERRAVQPGALAPLLAVLLEALKEDHGRQAGVIASQLQALLVRAWMQAGQPARAWQVWQPWRDQVLAHPPKSPDYLLEALDGLGAGVAILTDLRRGAAAHELVELLLRWAEPLRVFPRVPAVGRVRGALGQLLLLTGHPEQAWPEFLEQLDHVREPADLAVGYGFALAALGRGAVRQKPGQRTLTMLREALTRLSLTDRQFDQHPVLLWGALEAVVGLAPEQRSLLGGLGDAVLSAAGAAVDRARQSDRWPNPLPLLARVLGQWHADDDLFALAYAHMPVGTKLREGGAYGRQRLRTVAAWAVFGRGGPALNEAWQAAKSHVQSALEDIKEGSEFDELRAYLQCFAELQATNPSACQAFLARGEA